MQALMLDVLASLAEPLLYRMRMQVWWTKREFWTLEHVRDSDDGNPTVAVTICFSKKHRTMAKITDWFMPVSGHACWRGPGAQPNMQGRAGHCCLSAWVITFQPSSQRSSLGA